MLEELRITDLGVIASAILEPGPGLTAITGETGAGKTMVLHGLDLLFGARADSQLVRAGAARAVVDGRLRVPADSPLRERLADAGISVDDDELVLTRSIGSDGRSRAIAGGRPVPVALLAELAADLLTVHGQADQAQLRHLAAQRATLDRFGGPAVASAAARYRDSYDRWRATADELEGLHRDGRAREEEADRLRADLARITALAPVAGEDAELAATAARLSHAEALRAAAGTAHAVLTGESAGEGAPGGGVGAMLAVAARGLTAVADHDPALGALAARLADAGYAIHDATSDLAAYLSQLDADPAALAAVHERIAALSSLIRRHGPDLAAVLSYAETAEQRLAELDAGDDRRNELAAALADAERELLARTGELTAARQAAAQRFSALVSAELAALAMPAATVGARISPLPAPTPAGGDEVEFTLAAHAGAAERPLARAASGGELSRVMLAVEVVLAGSDPVPTMVFDEVDAGVGGAAAVEVGRRLCRLARDHQVLVVTHLAQVAAFADRQLQVERDGDRTSVAALEGEARVRELSRMLAGLADSALARGHAEELLDLAARERGSVPTG